MKNLLNVWLQVFIFNKEIFPDSNDKHRWLPVMRRISQTKTLWLENGSPDYVDLQISFIRLKNLRRIVELRAKHFCGENIRGHNQNILVVPLSIDYMDK